MDLPNNTPAGDEPVPATAGYCDVVGVFLFARREKAAVTSVILRGKHTHAAEAGRTGKSSGGLRSVWRGPFVLRTAGRTKRAQTWQARLGRLKSAEKLALRPPPRTRKDIT